MRKSICLGALFSFVVAAQAKDLGFRYQNGKCLNGQNKEGLNPGFIGQCGDLSNVTLSNIDLTGVDFSGANFKSSDLEGNSFQQTNLTGASFVSAILSGVDFDGAILQQTDFSKASLQNAHLAGADISHANFTGADLSGQALSYAELNGVQFSGAKLVGATMDHAQLKGANLAQADLSNADLSHTVLDGASVSQAHFARADFTSASMKNLAGESADFKTAILRQTDLTGSHLKGASFRGAPLDRAKLNSADLTTADMRGAYLKDATLDGATLTGAIYSRSTALPFDASQAQTLGMVLGKGGLLVIWDTDGDNSEYDLLKDIFDKGNVEIQRADQAQSAFDGSQDLSAFQAILHIIGENYESDMPETGQKAILDFVRGGGNYISTEFVSYMAMNGKLQQMQDLVLNTFFRSSQDALAYTVTQAGAGHPLMAGVTSGTMVTCLQGFGQSRFTDDSSMQVLVEDQDQNGLVRVRNIGSGHAINMSIVVDYQGYQSCFQSDPVQKILLNAAQW